MTTRLPTDTDAGISATAKKLGDINKAYQAPLENSALQGNRIMDIGILPSVFSSLACSKCVNRTLKLEECSHEGMCSACAVKCTDCGFRRPFHTSRKCRQPRSKTRMPLSCGTSRSTMRKRKMMRTMTDSRLIKTCHYRLEPTRQAQCSLYFAMNCISFGVIGAVSNFVHQIQQAMAELGVMAVVSSNVVKDSNSTNGTAKCLYVSLCDVIPCY
ncbi:hypothetical protein HPB51_024804 [Rhipicephalus microplus]|uniref:Uncharacterized protein n=1 Tax=Rhipicephalus microplus TaxID=6941 RepID=A0A9J6F8S9_RHIMP|nr:hypothetical protein HPB51_024804 [Rhipicephalus microplus]